MSHAQLFVGDMGYGTLALAIAYAQYLNCQNRQHYTITDENTELAADSCGECPSCKKFKALVHSDLHMIFPNAATKKVDKNPSSADFMNEFRDFVKENNGYCSLESWFHALGVETKQGIINIRDGKYLIGKLSLMTYESPYKTAIVWLPEKMNGETANKLLKTIEEPTDNTLIMLVAEEREHLLSTILSRTQLINVHRIDDASLSAKLAGDHPELPTDELQKITQAAEGNYLAAKNFLQQSEERKEFAELFVNWMRKLFKLDIKTLSQTIDSISKLGREKQKLFLSYSLDVFRACFLKTSSGIESPYILSFDDEKFSRAFPAMITVNNIEKIENAINESLYNISRNAYDKITFMCLSFALSKSLKNR